MIEFRNKRIMIVVAHPDDELLGIGATINKLVSETDCKVHVVILGEGITSRSSNRNKEKWEEELKRHHKNILEAQKKIGYHSLKTYQLPDNRFDSIDLLDVIKIVEFEKEEFDPDIVFTHHSGDLNIDHRITFQSVLTSFRPLSNEKIHNIFTFETPSGTEWQSSFHPEIFRPNFFIEVTKENLNAKILGMECYKYEKREYPHPRSSKALLNRAEMWGIANGLNYAEAFCLIRGAF